MARGKQLFSFPHPVNEVSARLVAAGVALMSATALLLRQHWILIPLAYGFAARFLTGPTLSPLGQLVTRVVTPRLGVAPRLVAGPPKRFAQGIGAVVTLTALALHYAFGLTTAADLLLGLMVVFAFLESAFALCVGCRIFSLLMRLGVIPESVCAECDDFTARLA